MEKKHKWGRSLEKLGKKTETIVLLFHLITHDKCKLRVNNVNQLME